MPPTQQPGGRLALYANREGAAVLAVYHAAEALPVPATPCASGPVRQAHIETARAQFLCHMALRADRHSPGAACCSLARETRKVWGRHRRRGARHAHQRPGLSQNDGYTALILRAGRPESGLAPSILTAPYAPAAWSRDPCQVAPAKMPAAMHERDAECAREAVRGCSTPQPVWRRDSLVRKRFQPQQGACRSLACGCAAVQVRPVMPAARQGRRAPGVPPPAHSARHRSRGSASRGRDNPRCDRPCSSGPGI